MKLWAGVGQITPCWARLAMAVLAVAGWLGSAESTVAQSVPARVVSEAPQAVLELFTSQGCSSCPPADALLGIYAAKSDIVALTFPVDYWDYLGWKDTLAQQRFSKRQRLYAKHRGDGKIYTPQVVINGMAHVNGASQGDIDAGIAMHAATFAKSRVPVKIRLEAGQIVIETGTPPEGAAPQNADIWLLLLQRNADVAIKTGENRGKSIKYTNVVREKTAIGMWTGTPQVIRLNKDTIALPEIDACAVLIQGSKVGAIHGVAMLGKL